MVHLIHPYGTSRGILVQTAPTSLGITRPIATTLIMTTSQRMEIPTHSREVTVAVPAITRPVHTTMVLDGRFKQVLVVVSTTTILMATRPTCQNVIFGNTNLQESSEGFLTFRGFLFLILGHNVLLVIDDSSHPIQ